MWTIVDVSLYWHHPSTPCPHPIIQVPASKYEEPSPRGRSRQTEQSNQSELKKKLDMFPCSTTKTRGYPLQNLGWWSGLWSWWQSGWQGCISFWELFLRSPVKCFNETSNQEKMHTHKRYQRTVWGRYKTPGWCGSHMFKMDWCNKKTREDKYPTT